MEQMPYQSTLEPTPLPSLFEAPQTIGSDDWRTALPRLTGEMVGLRELRPSDASPLFEALSHEQVSRFISPPPATVDGFGRFINWTLRQREAGRYVVYAVVLQGSDTPVGLFQVRALDSSFETAEWGFALARECWGAGVFVDAARQVADFAFTVIGVHRLEARASLQNARGNGALRKLGAVREGVLRRSFSRNGECFDQALWTIIRDEWLQAKATWGSPVIH
jgi:ribosomal-protein-alanine N-acetyltransferase